MRERGGEVSRFLVISEGERPATAEPLFATGDGRLVSVALDAVFDEIRGREGAALPDAERPGAGRGDER